MDNQNGQFDQLWDDLIFERHIIYDLITQQWAVKPTDSDIIARFATRQAAIDYAYELATSIEGDWCDIVVFDEAGNKVEIIDPEENLELSDKTKALLRLDMEGKLDYADYHPSEEAIDDVETHSVHHRDSPPSS